ncbi:MAG: acetolactate synthase large subunit [Pseudomonadales bacterium]|nr:acetolactate synthase large subunit [Pseudomonadales bacterium]
MNGAESLLQTLINQGVEVCFTNPGTSEMHMVAAIGKTQGMRSILCLFEGVCSGAADGYGRMAGKPACTLLHLGPGLSNASANIHNARKGNSPMLNLVGDHATYHKKYDAPLTSDITGLAQPVSHWVKTTDSAANLPRDAADAVAEARVKPGRISTLIVPADCAWDESVEPVAARPAPEVPVASEAAISEAAALLKNGKNTLLLLGNQALTETGMALADQIAQVTGARILCDTFFTRMPRGEGRAQVERLQYFAEMGVEQIQDCEQLIMVGTKAPVAFFAYPGKPSEFYQPEARLHTLATVGENAEDALARLAQETGAADTAPRLAQRLPTTAGSDELSPRTLAMSFAHFLPTDAIVVDEGATAGGGCYPATANAEPHDWLTLTGGSIGYGLPTAIGAAVACPDRKVIALHGDGGAMYTIQALWTMARENLDICVVILANRKYQILQIELARVGAQTMNKKTLDMLDIGNPDLDFVALAQGMGITAHKASTIEQFNESFETAMRTQGPCLIEAVLP